MTPQTIITLARYIFNDTDSVLYRQSNTELLGYVNDGMQAVSALRPDWFTSIGDLACTAATVEQSVTFVGAQSLVGVLSIHGGAALTPFDMMTMNAFNPNWRTDTAAAATQWSRMPNDPLRFFIYPQAPASQTLDVVYTAIPTVLALTDSIVEIPSGYEGAMVDYVVARVEQKDDEHVLSGRAAASYAAFVSKIKGV